MKEEITEKKGGPWYHKPVLIVIAILCVGPLALPLVWMSPRLSKVNKVAITVIVLLLTVWLVRASVDMYGYLMDRLEEIREVLQDIQA